MKTVNEIRQAIEQQKTRGAWANAVKEYQFIMPHYDIIRGGEIQIRHGERYPAHKTATDKIVAIGDDGQEYIIQPGRYTTTKREQVKILSGYNEQMNGGKTA